MVLPYNNMNLPRVYTCSQSWTPLPPRSLYHPSGSSQCTSPKHPVSCIKPGLAILACCDSWGRKESDTTERLIWSDLIWWYYTCFNVILPKAACFLTVGFWGNFVFWLTGIKYIFCECFLPICGLSEHNSRDTVFWSADVYNLLISFINYVFGALSKNTSTSRFSPIVFILHLGL